MTILSHEVASEKLRRRDRTIRQYRIFTTLLAGALGLCAGAIGVALAIIARHAPALLFHAHQ